MDLLPEWERQLIEREYAVRQAGTLNTTERGYGYAHQHDRQTYLATFVPRQPCARCGQAMHNWPHMLVNGRYTCDYCDLGHIDGTTKRIYAGLEHRSCNRAAGARLKNRRNRRSARQIVTNYLTWRPSRDW